MNDGRVEMQPVFLEIIRFKSRYKTINWRGHFDGFLQLKQAAQESSESRNHNQTEEE